MALLDGELSSAEAQHVSTHLDHCAECADLASQLRGTSQSLSQWTVQPVPESLNTSVCEIAAMTDTNRKSRKPETYTRLSFSNWRLWAIGGTGAVATVLIGAAVISSTLYREDQPARMQFFAGAVEKRAANSFPTDGQPITDRRSKVAGGGGAPASSNTGVLAYLDSPGTPELNAYSEALSHPAGDHVATAATAIAAPPPAPATAPMIARTISLTIRVKDAASSRASLDTILARHHGYAAQLTVNTAENASRSFQASLRIPAPDLAAAIAEIRTLGRVQVETQSGEEVTQQHADLVARLQNSRETEQRLRDLLAQRTGKIDEVLQVEEEIDRVRGEIESMEAQQKNLEHRVDFASVDLRLVEEYKEQFNAQPDSVSTRMHNAFVTGLRHASGALLGIVLFLEEFVPVILIWLVILGVPAILAWRRYRKARTEI
jgi:anti-sigma factor ChrR (cupin superfamily)